MQRVGTGRPGRFDHTYVTSDCGYTWRCFVRAAGGTQVCADMGDSNIANCLATPGETAGIVYGVTGVCHQASNRILFPANRAKVSGARGYSVSVVAYGPYGNLPWTELTLCYPPGPTIHGSGLTRFGTSLASAAGVSARRSPSPRAPMESDVFETEMARRIRDLRDLVDAHPAAGIDEDRFERLVQAQTVFWLRKDDLAAAMEQGSIEPDRYLEQFNAALAEAMDRSRAAIGGHAFAELFGEAGEHPEDLVDPEIFEAEHRPSPMLRPF
ncbi:hypothetical protein [Methylobacterium oxalidis]|uniref:hypothetical protein n=1 Tax=Methylobacterium oxalidis TaxID=944322 RepID=UPI003316200E